MLYKGLKGAASIPTNDLVPPIRHVRMHHPLASPFANTDIYKSSFFPHTIGDSEIGIHLQILSFLLLKVQKTVSKFTSLVKARD